MFVIGSTEAVLGAMFRQQDAHVTQWRRWRYLYDRGIVDARGVILIGRRAGQPMRSR